MTHTTPELVFRGGRLLAFLPVAGFLAFCLLFFVVFKAFDMSTLAMGGFLSLLVGALFAKPYASYWNAVLAGIGSPTSVSIVMILFSVGMVSAMIKATNVSSGFVWMAQQLGVGGGTFTLFAFVAVCVISMSTASSIGTMFTAFPIFYPAGVPLGADPAFLAGAIISGAIFGDNVAPISDTTVISSSTQRFRRKDGTSDIAGVVRSRARFAFLTAGIAAIGFFFLGNAGAGGAATGAEALGADASPLALVMLIPVGLILTTALLTRDIFKAVTVGLSTGIVTGLLSGLLHPAEIIGVKDDVPTGFLLSGVTDMLPTIALVISVFGIMGVLTQAGILDALLDARGRSRFSRTPRGAEAAIGIGISVTTLLFGGVNSAALLTFGPVADELGARVGLHPYRRAVVMDCFAMSIACVVPVLSAYLFICAALTSGHEGVPTLARTQIFVAMLYPMILTVVMIASVATGWGRRFEGEGGAVSRTPVAELATTPEPAR
ncbi:sodium:proton antiporter [Leifsonia xyli subsp. xyli]|uniref:Na+/H+ antiporter n=2 Tax=Leifsonia xyli subsp. xyli TaxID=59736 RepID=Q6AFF3_LEIXX|nr:Na+/H+ antiporter NhaC family protein [Leifsonia xyli]AAT88892.1 Na+/H+ antiporter [Leifsonia xyli subsp. xyli str. CTCB07]ODA90377.1 sodium:proton antiporter [Leifsonia xyli subsp. xyli]